MNELMTSKSVPQECVLGPLMYLLCINNIQNAGVQEECIIFVDTS